MRPGSLYLIEAGFFKLVLVEGVSMEKSLLNLSGKHSPSLVVEPAQEFKYVLSPLTDAPVDQDNNYCGLAAKLAQGKERVADFPQPRNYAMFNAVNRCVGEVTWLHKVS